MKSKKKKINFTILKCKKELKIILLVLAILAFFFMIILGSASSVIYDRDAYFREQKNSNVYERVDKERAQNITAEVIRFLRYKPELETDFFGEDEILHLQDVKKLMNKLHAAYYISVVMLIIFFLAYYKTTDDFSRSFTSILIYGGIFTLVIFGIFYFINFGTLFDKFHIIFFEGNYAFSPESSLIKLFPETFFKGMFASILNVALIKTIVLLFGGILINSLDYFIRIRQARP